MHANLGENRYVQMSFSLPVGPCTTTTTILTTSHVADLYRMFILSLRVLTPSTAVLCAGVSSKEEAPKPYDRKVLCMIKTCSGITMIDLVRAKGLAPLTPMVA